VKKDRSFSSHKVLFHLRIAEEKIDFPKLLNYSFEFTSNSSQDEFRKIKSSRAVKFLLKFGALYVWSEKVKLVVSSPEK